MARVPIRPKPDTEVKNGSSEPTLPVQTDEVNEVAVAPVVVEDVQSEPIDSNDLSDIKEIEAVEDNSLPEIEDVQEDPVSDTPSQSDEITYLSASEFIRKSQETKLKSLISRLDKFADDNKTGKTVSLDQGARNDIAFWATLKDVLAQPTLTEFRRQWSIVILFFKHHEDGVLSDRYINRFISHWTIPFKEANAFRAIVNLLKVSTDQRSRELAIKSVNLPRLTNTLDNEQARQNVMMFYTK